MFFYDPCPPLTSTTKLMIFPCTFYSHRVRAGSTTVLTLTILGIENKSQLPKVSYITALDIYVALCFVFVLATTIEFAVVHYFTKYGTGEPLMISSDDESSMDEVSSPEQCRHSITSIILNDSQITKFLPGLHMVLRLNLTSNDQTRSKH